jgi:hypothetical protein
LAKAITAAMAAMTTSVLMATMTMTGKADIPSDSVIHRVFKIRPTSVLRSFLQSEVRPVSKMAQQYLRTELVAQSAEERYAFYMKMRSLSSPYAGTMFEDGVQAFLTSLAEPTSFTIRSLEDPPSESFQITFPPHTSCSFFHGKHAVGGLLSHSL